VARQVRRWRRRRRRQQQRGDEDDGRRTTAEAEAFEAAGGRYRCREDGDDDGEGRRRRRDGPHQPTVLSVVDVFARGLHPHFLKNNVMFCFNLSILSSPSE